MECLTIDKETKFISREIGGKLIKILIYHLSFFFHIHTVDDG